MERYICIHGHFYQPPRENPWLEAIEVQDSAYPYHDWNERIAAECYGPNTTSRILDDTGRIVEIVNNYNGISFNFGPTLLSWMQQKAPDVYAAILEADKQSVARFSGHGSAIAQGYNHLIMPLANSRDKRTQAVWGLRDFEHRFGRKPEGMWLPETAVDLETLDILSSLDIRFTILSPYQARRVRPISGDPWQEIEGGKVDPTRAYTVSLPSGRSIAVFFYDGPISQAIAFERLLAKGETLAARLTDAFSESRDWPQLIHIATDGETYGHHHRHGDMALAYALRHIEADGVAKLTNYGQYLERHPPTHEAEIIENTAWSCAHGVDRWRADCGCCTGTNNGWTQAWRAPMRQALDWLRDTVGEDFETKAGALLKDPWAGRDDYIEVVLDRSATSLESFLERHAVGSLSQADSVTAVKLMELQRHLMLMYTSCGWFFDEISNVEPVQCLRYAALALQLAEELFGKDLEAQFIAQLSKAPSNVRRFSDGARVYQEVVKPSVVDMHKVCAHYAVSSLFEDYEQTTDVYCYTVKREDYRLTQAGRVKMAAGRVALTSKITGESARLSFGLLHFGDHNVNGGVRDARGTRAYQAFARQIGQAFEGADLPQVIRLLDKNFSELTFSLRSLFRDEQLKIRDLILQSSLAEAEAAYRQLYEHHGTLIRHLAGLDIPMPGAFHGAMEFVFNTDLRRVFEFESLDLHQARSLLEDAERWGIDLDQAGLAYTLRGTMERLAENLHSCPSDMSVLVKMDGVVEFANSLPFEVDLWKSQNLFYEVSQKEWPDFRARAQQGDGTAQSWVDQFKSLGEKLRVSIE